MSWNPLDWNSNDLKGFISGAGTGALAGGTLGGPVGAIIGGIGGGYLGGAASDNAQGQIKGAEAQKSAGYNAVIAAAEKEKQARIARQQQILQQTMAAYAPSRQAIAAVYGDPSTWKLK